MVSLEEAFYTNNSFLGPNVDLEGEKNYENNKRFVLRTYIFQGFL